MRCLVYPSTLLAALVLLANTASALTASQVAQQAHKSFFSVYIEREDNKYVQGSSFQVQQNILATNYHVVENARTGVAITLDGKQKFQIIKILAVDLQHDLALISISNNDYPSLRLGHDVELSVGDKVFVLSSPRGRTGTFSDGIISRFENIRGNLLMQFTAPISRGSSGAPIINESGLVVGVVCGFREGQLLNVGIPSIYLHNLIKTIQFGNQLSPYVISYYKELQKPSPPKKFVSATGKDNTPKKTGKASKPTTKKEKSASAKYQPSQLVTARNLSWDIPDGVIFFVQNMSGKIVRKIDAKITFITLDGKIYKYKHENIDLNLGPQMIKQVKSKIENDTMVHCPFFKVDIIKVD